MTVNHGFESRSRSGPSLILMILAVVAVVGGVWLRLQGERIGLWLDEAQSVGIASMPPADIIDGLRADGHPPLFYFLLHYWMKFVGTSDQSLRFLPAIFGGLTLIPGYFAGSRLGGSRAGFISVGLLASSPFLIRFSTEVRMYSLVTFLSLLWWLAVRRAEENPSKSRVAIVTVLVGLLVLTHYWSLFLFAAWLVLTLVRIGRRSEAPAAGKLVVAHAVGGLAFVPWIPSFLYQMAHTGTPWADAQDPASIVVTSLSDIAGGREKGSALALMALLFFFTVVGFAGRETHRGVIELVIEGRNETRPITALILTTLTIAIIAMTVTGSAFAGRYVSIFAALVLILAAVGVAELTPPFVQYSAFAAAIALGFAGGWVAVNDARSQGRQVAEVVAASYEPGDVVVACPDQIGPATSRYLPASASLVSYPLLTPANRVDWTDYAARHEAADPAAVAAEIVERADGAQIWLVWQEGYQTIEGQCSALHGELLALVGGFDVVGPDPVVFEPMWLSVFAPAAG